MGREKIQMPTVVLRGLTILPKMITHFDIDDVKLVKAVEKALTEEQKLFLVTQKNPEARELKKNQCKRKGLFHI